MEASILRPGRGATGAYGVGPSETGASHVFQCRGCGILLWTWLAKHDLDSLAYRNNESRRPEVLMEVHLHFLVSRLRHTLNVAFLDYPINPPTACTWCLRCSPPRLIRSSSNAITGSQSASRGADPNISSVATLQSELFHHLVACRRKLRRSQCVASHVPICGEIMIIGAGYPNTPLSHAL